MKNEEKRDKIVKVRLSESEVKSIKEKAEKMGISMSEYIRNSCLNCEVHIVQKLA